MRTAGKKVMDLLVTLVMWSYFAFGFFLLFFLPQHLPAWLLSRDKSAAFQRANSRFCRSFFALCRLITPGLRFEIAPEVMDIKGALMVCNHLSYFDPMLMVGIYPRHKTIVKDAALLVPFMSWLFRIAGYIPSRPMGRFSDHFIKQLQGVPEFLAAGGVLFIFPEGTRSRDGKLGEFAVGAFKIARQHALPIEVVYLEATDTYYRRGTVLLNTCVPICIKVQRLGTVTPDYESKTFSLPALQQQVQALYQARLDAGRLPETGTLPEQTP
jgi:1-acyl-sn-glycerol-3-phosphate acyltransferase